MMRLPRFQLFTPRDLPEALRNVSEADGDAIFVAGGTDLYPNMKRLQGSPRALVSLRNVRELRTIRHADDSALWIGAGMTLTQIERHPLVRELAPSLATAIPLVSTPLLRNMGTLGGNLCLDTRCHFLNQTAFWRR